MCCQHLVFQDSRLPHSSHNLLRTAVDFFILLRHFIIVWQGTIKPRPIHKIVVLHLNYKAQATTLPMDHYFVGWVQSLDSNQRLRVYETRLLTTASLCDMYARHLYLDKCLTGKSIRKNCCKCLILCQDSNCIKGV